jgi:peptidoglycan/xylan/chitin deacetylase (PgdA/CDA1 family)
VPSAALKIRLGRTRSASFLAPALLAAQRWAGARLSKAPFITIPSYHRAGKVGVRTEYDDGVIDVTPEAFGRQLDFLREHCTVIDLAELLAFVQSGGKRQLPANPVLITFDDGYLDNHHIVLPALVERGLSAVFFVATHYVEERRLFWWDRVSFIVKTTKKERLAITYPESTTLELGSDRARAEATRRLLRTIKDWYALDLDRFLDQLAEAADVQLSREAERRRADDLLMTWDHVRELRRAGMDVQSHTHTHRVLQTLPPERLAHELTTSRQKLQDVLGEPIRAVSYPVGKRLMRASHIRRAVEDAGYEIGFSNCSGVNHPWSFDPYDAKRMGTDADMTEGQFRAMIAMPYLAP